MATALPYQPPPPPPSWRERSGSFSSMPATRTMSNVSNMSNGTYKSSQPSLPSLPSLPKPSPPSSRASSRAPSMAAADGISSIQPRQRRLKSQYPLDSTERHVEYILVASFHETRGPIMEHQYPGAISGDENMLAELMLPDQTHVRSQDWTIFFLHKDTSAEEEEQAEKAARKQRRIEKKAATARGSPTNDEEEEEGSSEESEDEDEEDGDSEGPPLMYVLNLVNTKPDSTVKRGAVVKTMAICTRHSFLHIYKPLLLLALEEYFKSPFPETLAALYDAVNAMDLSLMPRLSLLERHIMQASDTKDMFIEKFERMIQQRMADEAAAGKASQSPDSPTKSTSRFTLPRDTHEFESKVTYNDIPIPIKVPTAISPETVGDFSLIKLIQTFGGPHATTPQPFALHPHLTTNGAYTHPVIVLVNALLTQKRIIFLGHNRPSGEVAEAVLAACALASGGVLRGFTRHAFPYTDLTKIDDLLKVPGFIAGVTNPAFANHPEWWDLLCDLPTGRMKISSRIEAAPVTEGQMFFQQQNPGLSTASINTTSSVLNSSSATDPTGDILFMQDIMQSVTSRHGEGTIRAKWRAFITKFTRVAAAFEESVYGASALYVINPNEGDVSAESPVSNKTDAANKDLVNLRGHGYVWADDTVKNRELAASVARIEGWRNTRSYYAFIQDLVALYYHNRPIKSLDLHHHHDRLRTRKLSHADSGAIYLALSAAIQDYNAVSQLLTVTPENQAGVFYISLGLFHPDLNVRAATVDLLERIAGHEAGRHFWNQLGRFAKLAFIRVKREREGGGSGSGSEQHSLVGVAMGDTGSLGVGRAS